MCLMDKAMTYPASMTEKEMARLLVADPSLTVGLLPRLQSLIRNCTVKGVRALWEARYPGT